MRPLLSYSRKKFQSFSQDAQIKALAKLLSSLEKALAVPESIPPLAAHVAECIGWMGKPLPENVLGLADDLKHDPDPHRISQAITRFQSSLGLTSRDEQITLREGDGPRFTDPATLKRGQSVIVILDNLRSVFNIGSIFRSAECLALKEIWLCGVCATPENPALGKTAMGTGNRVPWRHYTRTSAAIEDAKAQGYCVYALETTADAGSVFSSDYGLPLALVVGNESLGIAEEVLTLCDHYISLPVQGWKNSLNVAVAFAICAYQIVFGRPKQANDTGEDHA